MSDPRSTYSGPAVKTNEDALNNLGSSDQMSHEEQMKLFRRRLEDWRIDYTGMPSWRNRHWRSKRSKKKVFKGHVLDGKELGYIGERFRVTRRDAYLDYYFEEGNDALPGGPWEIALAQERAHRHHVPGGPHHEPTRISQGLQMDLAENEYVSLEGLYWAFQW